MMILIYEHLYRPARSLPRANDKGFTIYLVGFTIYVLRYANNIKLFGGTTHVYAIRTCIILSMCSSAADGHQSDPDRTDRDPT